MTRSNRHNIPPIAFSLFVAKRYFFSGKKKHFINIISWLSITSVAFCTAALVIILSVFNGFDDLLHKLYASFDPELKIEAKKGKSFEVSPALLAKIKAIPHVDVITEVIEDYAYMRYGDAGMVVTFKGVGNNFIAQHRLDKAMVQGTLKLQEKGINYAIIGNGVQRTLSVNIEKGLHAIQLFYIKNGKTAPLRSLHPYTTFNVMPGGVFSIEKTHDENYVFIPLEVAKKLSNYGNRRTSLELKIYPKEEIKQVQATLRNVLGSRFHVLNREEQQKDLFRLIRVEKLFTFLSLSLLILVGSMNTFFSLMMLALDKKRELSVLSSMGAEKRSIFHIFLFTGAFISLVGAGTGLALGACICWLQQTVGLVGLGMRNAIIKNYPIEMIWSDFALIGLVIIIITWLVSFYPARLATRSHSTHYL